jgi:hypothetical protein
VSRHDGKYMRIIRFEDIAARYPSNPGWKNSSDD